MKKRVTVIHGPNLNMLGKRDTGVYGSRTMEEINTEIAGEADKLGVDIDFFQSNSEGEIIDRLQECRDLSDGVVLNAGAYTHYSIAIRDAISDLAKPVVEVHISNIHKREDFRHISVLAPVCTGQISGFGAVSYVLALRGILEFLD